MYETVSGIQPAKGSAGFDELLLAPIPGERLGFVRCSLETVRGKIESEWVYENGNVRFRFAVPEGVNALIRLPDGRCFHVIGGNHEYVMNIQAIAR